MLPPLYSEYVLKNYQLIGKKGNYQQKTNKVLRETIRNIGDYFDISHKEQEYE